MHREPGNESTGELKYAAMHAGRSICASCTGTCLPSPDPFQFSMWHPGIPRVCFIECVSDKVSTNNIRFHAVCALAFFCGPIPGAWIWLVGHKMANAAVNQKEVGAVRSFCAVTQPAC